MKVIVTGGNGFIGCHIVEALTAAGHQVTVLDNREPYRSPYPKDWRRVDLSYQYLDETGLATCDVLIHAAAYADIRHAWNIGEGEKHIRNNVTATYQLLKATNPHAHVVYLSSASVYGSMAPTASGFTECDPPSPETMYASTKLLGESIVQSFGSKNRNPWTIFRLSNVVGAGMRRGHIYDFQRQVEETGALTALDDGSQRKSFVNVLDVADVVVESLQSAVVPAITGLYNLSSDEVWPWRDTVEVMREICPKHLATFTLTYPIGKDAAWPGDPKHIRVVADKLRSWYDAPMRAVRDGVIDALHELGWGRSLDSCPTLERLETRPPLAPAGLTGT